MTVQRFIASTVAGISLMASSVFAQSAAPAAASGSVAKVSVVEGVGQLMRTTDKDWKPAKPGMILKVGDQVNTQAESFMEIRYTTGAVLRMDENTKITIASATETAASTKTGVGQVWVNMKKMAGSGNQFEVVSPTATAAIRGTVFQMSTAKDSASDVSVFDGKVAVGPSDDLKKQLKKPVNPEQIGEVPGPEEVPGPYEVPLETWKMIVAGQKISVRKDGKFAQEKFDMKAAANDAFVKRCQELDKKLAAE